MAARRLQNGSIASRDLVAERGSIRYLNSEDDLEAAILYVRDGQDFDRYEP